MPKPQIPTVRKGLKDIAAAIGVSISQLYIAMKDPTFPIKYIGTIPLMDTESFRQWLYLQAEVKEPSEEQIQAAARRYIKERLG